MARDTDTLGEGGSKAEGEGSLEGACEGSRGDLVKTSWDGGGREAAGP